MPFDKSLIKKILVISLSNIGDVILTFPVMDILRRDFPEAHIDIVVGPKARDFFEGNPNFHGFFIFDKRQPLMETVKWLKALRGERYDLVVDLRHTAIPLFIGGRYRTPIVELSKKKVHMKEKHLQRLAAVYPFSEKPSQRYSVYMAKEFDRMNSLEQTLKSSAQKIVVVGPGAADQAKCWKEEGFASICDTLIHEGSCSIIFVGDSRDQERIQRIKGLMKERAVDLSGKTSLRQLAAILQKAHLVIVNDSAIMHLASYLDRPLVAIFGPTDPQLYGPWSSQSCVIKKVIECPACAKKKKATHICLQELTVKEVLGPLQRTFPFIFEKS